MSRNCYPTVIKSTCSGHHFFRPSFARMRKRSLHGRIHGVSNGNKAKVCRISNCGAAMEPALILYGNDPGGSRQHTAN